MAASGGAAGAAVDRLRAARERSRLRLEASRQAVERLRQRNREESRMLAERAGVTRGQRSQLPGHGRPREMHLFDTEDPDALPARPPPAEPEPPASPRQPGRRPPEDDWPQESWLH